MKPTLLPALCACLAATVSPPPARADAAPAPFAVAQALARAEAAAGPLHDLEIAVVDADLPGTGRIVKGAPYCADAVHETVQWLPDPSGAAANRIVRRQTTRLCRDGEGRTRQEVERGPRRWVYLHDPVAGTSWVLDPERRTARRLGGGADARDRSAERIEWRDYAERMREWARAMAERARSGHAATPPAPPAPPVPPTPPEPVVITRGDGHGPLADVHVLRRRLGDAAPSELAVPPPGVAWRAQALAPRGRGVTTPLGTREIDGLRAHGERTTWTLAAGQVGNEKPIVITREVWTAPELMVTLSAHDFDPRSGEVVYRLQNLRRGEPDPALMQVPPDHLRPPRPPASGPRG